MRPKIDDFQATVYEFYDSNGRHDLPWRLPEPDASFDPYKILVSEMMLQQTQVNRVKPKFLEFMQRFPNVETLASAELGEVLRSWSGLGYNRRAKYLHGAAKAIVSSGTFPTTATQLTTLPGIGPNSAGAVLAYSYNQALVFVETNIRTVIIHHFFADRTDIPERDIEKLVRQTLDSENPRIWYWALMDYGSFLKQTIGNLNQAARLYNKQSAFDGSRRQIRGRVIHLLGYEPSSEAELMDKLAERLADVLNELVAEGLVRRQGSRYLL
jgi:A/G-specific adenine glycosylase